MREGGVLIISTPISAMSIDTKPYNPYHIQEWGFEYFQEVMAKHFTITDIYLQVYPAIKKMVFWQRVYNRFYNIFFPLPLSINTLPEASIYNASERKVNKNELGSIVKGYQILVCKK